MYSFELTAKEKHRGRKPNWTKQKLNNGEWVEDFLTQYLFSPHSSPTRAQFEGDF